MQLNPVVTANVKTYDAELEDEVVAASSTTGTDPPPFEWVEFSRATEGETAGRGDSPPGGSRGRIQASEEQRPVERVVPITLTNTREGRSRSRDKPANPFLEPSGPTVKPGDEKTAEAKIAPLATAEVTAILHPTTFSGAKWSGSR